MNTIKSVFLFLVFASTVCLASENLVVVSERHEFKDADKLSHGTYRRLVSVHHPFHSHDMNGQEWLEAKKGERVALVVHGYNSNYEHAMKFFKDVEERSASMYDKIICYLWPAGDEFWEYFEAIDRIDDTDLTRRLARLIGEIQLEAKEVDIIAHSMGCLLTAKAVAHHESPTIENVFMMAPAIDEDGLKSKFIDKCSELIVFYSHFDDVLKWAFPIAEWDRALGLKGDGTSAPNILYVDSSSHVHSHEGYATSHFVFSEIATVLGQEDNTDPRRKNENLRTFAKGFTGLASNK